MNKCQSDLAYSHAVFSPTSDIMIFTQVTIITLFIIDFNGINLYRYIEIIRTIMNYLEHLLQSCQVY